MISDKETVTLEIYSSFRRREGGRRRTRRGNSLNQNKTRQTLSHMYNKCPGRGRRTRGNRFNRDCIPTGTELKTVFNCPEESDKNAHESQRILNRFHSNKQKNQKKNKKKIDCKPKNVEKFKRQ